jgi:hypothetical protein
MSSGWSSKLKATQIGMLVNEESSDIATFSASSINGQRFSHIPVGMVFGFDTLHHNEIVPYPFGKSTQVKNRNQQIVKGTYRFDSVKRNILSFSKYPPQDTTYGVINHSMLVLDDDVEYQETAISTQDIPLKNLGNTNRNGWNGKNIIPKVAPPMGILPIGTVIQFTPELLKTSLIFSPWTEALELFQKLYKTNNFGKSLIGYWVITANAGVNADGLVPTKSGKIKRLYGNSYTLRKLKLNKDAKWTDISGENIFETPQFYADNQQNCIELRAEHIHALLGVSIKCIDELIKHTREQGETGWETFEEWINKWDYNFSDPDWAEREDVINEPLNWDTFCKDLDTQYEKWQDVFSNRGLVFIVCRKGYGGYIKEDILASMVTIGLQSHMTSVYHINPGKYDEPSPNNIVVNQRRGGMKHLTDITLKSSKRLPYFSLPIANTGHKAYFCFDANNSIFHPISEHLFSAFEHSYYQDLQSIRFPTVWYIQRWLYKYPSYGGLPWADYQASPAYLKLVLDSSNATPYTKLKGNTFLDETGINMPPIALYAYDRKWWQDEMISTKEYSIVGNSVHGVE